MYIIHNVLKLLERNWIPL